jgi:hypothetical protein
LELVQQKKRVFDLNESHKDLRNLTECLTELEWFCLKDIVSINSNYSYSMDEFRQSLKTAITETIENMKIQPNLTIS